MTKKKGPTPKRAWQPLRRGVNYVTPEKAAKVRALLGRDPILGEEYSDEVWLNDKYVVHVRRRDDKSVVSLSIRRQDRQWPRDWRDFQRIKNEIAGPTVEAVELYPSEERLVDTANQFWLWCLPPGEPFELGFFDGRTVSGVEQADKLGAGQREFDGENSYHDLPSSELPGMWDRADFEGGATDDCEPDYDYARGRYVHGPHEGESTDG